MKNNTTEVSTTTQNSLSVVNLSGNLPDLSTAEAYPFDLMSDYWTPELPMESKRVFFDKISTRPVLAQESDEIIDLECAFFIEQTKEGIKTISNGSKRLVGAIQASQIQQGTPLLITFLGKKKNSTNNYKSDSWSVKPLRINIG